MYQGWVITVPNNWNNCYNYNDVWGFIFIQEGVRIASTGFCWQLGVTAANEKTTKRANTFDNKNLENTLSGIYLRV